MTASELEPVAPRERLLTLDVLRGIALFGVLYANLTWIYCLRADEPAATDALADILALRFLTVMVTSKAQTLLVLLFGLGFANQLLRAEARSEPVLPIYLRRIAALFTIGWCHVLFLAYLDVTWGYAVAAVFLLPFVRTSNRSRFLVGAALTIAAGAVSAIPALYDAVHGALFAHSPDEYLGAVATAARAADRPALIVANAKMALVATVGGGVVWYIPSLVGRFLLGYVVGAQRWFAGDGADNLELWRRVFGIGLAVAAVSVLVQLLEATAVIPQPMAVMACVTTMLWHVGLVALAATLAAIVVFLAQRPLWRRVMALVAPVGRMPLTTYLMQSLICTYLFYGFGLDWSPPRAGACLAITTTIFVAQIAMAHVWLRFYRFGPAEWLWRTIVYWRVQPMRA